jgi:hypothetical protein
MRRALSLREQEVGHNNHYNYYYYDTLFYTSSHMLLDGQQVQLLQ